MSTNQKTVDVEMQKRTEKDALLKVGDDPLQGDLIEEPTERETAMMEGQRLIFGSTFMNYAMAHWTRKSYTNVKVQLMLAGVSPLTLTAMDSGFMFTYAGGSFITGQLGDNFSPVVVVGLGLLGSTICLFGILLGASTSIIHSAALCGGWFLTCQLLHGAFQATGGPVNTAIMGKWFGKENRGFIFGLWTCHQYIGDIAAALFSGIILYNKIDWRWCIIVPAVINGVWAFFNFFKVPNKPSEYSQVLKDPVGSAASKAEEEDQPIGFCVALSLPNVMNYAIAFGFFKLVNYAMFFQLPVILSSHFSPTTANLISALYSVGMMPGGVVCGWVSDYLQGRRACVIAIFMGLLCPLLLLFALAMDKINVYLLLILLCFMGCLVGGPNNIISSAVSADLADDPSLKGSKKALGTVTGIINGSGSVTACLGQLAIPILYNMGKADGVAYRYVWFFLILCTAVGTLLLSPRIIKEIQSAPETKIAPSEQGYQAVAGTEATPITTKESRAQIL